MLADLSPNPLHHFEIRVLQLPANRARPGQGVDFPKLRSVAVIGFVCGQWRDQGSLLAVGSKSGIDSSDCSFTAWLCHRRYQVLRSACLFANKQHVEVRAITQFAAAKFSKRDDRYVFSAQKFVRKGET